MASKKDDILQMLAEGKTVDDIVDGGFTRKYVNEVIRNSKNRNSYSIPTEDARSTSDIDETKKDRDIVCLQTNIEDIKKILNCDIQNSNTGNNHESKKNQIEAAIKMLQFILASENLLQCTSLNINIAVTDSDIRDNVTISEKLTEQIEKETFEKINPIKVYREKGEPILRDILKKYSIAVLKDIVRQYTPDTRGYVYKWNDIDKIVDYIVERASSLSEKGSVFVSDSK